MKDHQFLIVALCVFEKFDNEEDFIMDTKRLLAANYHYKRYTLDYFLDSVAKIGFENIELWASGPHFHLDYFTKQDLVDLKTKIKNRGLSVRCLTPEQSVYPISISHPDANYRQASVDFFNRHIETAVKLECDRMLVTTGIDYLNVPEADKWKSMVESMAKIVTKAEAEGVTLALEAFTKYSTQSMSRSDQMRKLIDEINSPNLQGLIDTDCLAATGEESVADYLENLKNHLDHIHFVDGNPGGHLVPGDGILDMEGALKAIETSGYQGYYGLEFLDRRYYIEPNKALERTIEWFAKQGV